MTVQSIAAILLFTIVCFAGVTQGRQMCLSCQYQTGLEAGLPCVNDPFNWPMGAVDVRCPIGLCSLQLRRETKTGRYTYAHRGCTGDTVVTQKDGCYENGEVTYCYFTCFDVNYCNNWNETDIFVSSYATTLHLPPLATFVFALYAVTQYAVC